MATQQTQTQAVPPVRLEPGWYWWHYIRSTDEASWAAFKVANERTLKLRKIFPGDTSPASVVVFELLEPIAWTLRGIPSKAPKKGRTELRDLSNAPEFKSPELVQLATEAGEVVSNAGTVGKVLLWGGAAVLLVNLWRWSDPPRREYHSRIGGDD